MDKEVCVVTDGTYSDYRILAVFSTREKAEEFVKYAGGGVEVYPLDEPLDEKWHILIAMRRDGTVESAKRFLATNSIGFSGFNGYLRGFYGELPAEERSLLFYVKGTDEERAVKIVNEKRALILEEGCWGNYERTKDLLGMTWGTGEVFLIRGRQAR